MDDRRHLESPEYTVPRDTALDLAMQHEQALGHSTTTLHKLGAVACDDCDYLLILNG